MLATLLTDWTGLGLLPGQCASVIVGFTITEVVYVNKDRDK